MYFALNINPGAGKNLGKGKVRQKPRLVVTFSILANKTLDFMQTGFFEKFRIKTIFYHFCHNIHGIGKEK